MTNVDVAYIWGFISGVFSLIIAMFLWNIAREMWQSLRTKRYERKKRAEDKLKRQEELNYLLLKAKEDIRALFAELSKLNAFTHRENDKLARSLLFNTSKRSLADIEKMSIDKVKELLEKP